jgi:hypothetical protein
MGCDIHVHTEVKIKGKWEHFSHTGTCRNYGLFEKMAGVRGSDENAISLPKGVPPDISSVTEHDLESWDCDAHSRSWFSRDEIKQLYRWWKDEHMPKYGGSSYLSSEEYFGHGPQYMDWDDAELPEGIEDVRWVFWFDN